MYTCCYLARQSALLGMDGQELVHYRDNVTEWDITSCYWRPDLRCCQNLKLQQPSIHMHLPPYTPLSEKANRTSWVLISTDRNICIVQPTTNKYLCIASTNIDIHHGLIYNREMGTINQTAHFTMLCLLVKWPENVAESVPTPGFPYKTSGVWISAKSNQWLIALTA